MKKSIVAAALVLGLLVVGCNDDKKATPVPTTPAAAVESIAAEVQEAVATQAAEVEDVVESMLPEASAAA